MSISNPDSAEARSKSLCFEENTLIVLLTDGREISAPILWYPRFSISSKQERANYQLIGKGVGIHWLT